MTGPLDAYRWLVSDAATPWLRQWTGHDVTPSLLRELRRDLPAEQARLIAEQVALRSRAKRKFPDADRLFFLARGLEQATDHFIARYKSATLPSDARVADLGCGLGGDAMALARSRPLLAVDIDPICCLLTAANLRTVGAAAFTVIPQNASHVTLQDYDYWHVDPDRRPTGRRTVRSEQMRPSAAELLGWRSVNPHAAIKLAPASPLPPELAQHAEREWIGHSRACQQQLIRTGYLARHPGRRVATVLLNHEEQTWQTQTLVEVDSQPPETATSLSSYLLEPHAVVIAAGLARQWAAEHGYLQFSSNVAYFTGEQPASDASATSFRVAAQLPLRLRKIRDWLRAHQAGVVEVKKRGIDTDPQKWLRALSLEGDRQLTLLLFPLESRPVAVLAERLPGR